MLEIDFMIFLDFSSSFILQLFIFNKINTLCFVIVDSFNIHS